MQHAAAAIRPAIQKTGAPSADMTINAATLSALARAAKDGART
jgi:hypothetical protein